MEAGGRIIRPIILVPLPGLFGSVPGGSRGLRRRAGHFSLGNEEQRLGNHVAETPL